MAGSEEPEGLRCACGALLLRATAEGIELHCRRCDRRLLIPFAELQGKEHLIRFMDRWRASVRRSRS